MKATQKLPEGYRLSESFDLKNRKVLIWLNVLGVVTLIFFFLIFGAVFMILRPDAFGAITISTDSFLDTILFLIILIVTVFIVLVLHEIIHGVFFWLFSSQKPIFGFKGFYAYTTLPGWYFPKKQYLVIGSAPLILISMMGIALIQVVPFNSLWIIFIALVVNGSGSVGDLVVTARLMLKPKTAMAMDMADTIEFYVEEQFG